jgi:hypothetical protein
MISPTLRPRAENLCEKLRALEAFLYWTVHFNGTRDQISSRLDTAEVGIRQAANTLDTLKKK